MWHEYLFLIKYAESAGASIWRTFRRAYVKTIRQLKKKKKEKREKMEKKKFYLIMEFFFRRFFAIYMVKFENFVASY